jgi:hypothetical protein
LEPCGATTALAGKWQLEGAVDDPALCEVKCVSDAISFDITQVNADTKQQPATPADFGFDTYAFASANNRYWGYVHSMYNAFCCDGAELYIL